MRKLIATSLLVLGATTAAFATVPEIDAGSSIGAVGLIAGALLVLRARRKK